MTGIKKYFIQEHLHRKVIDGGAGNADAEKIFLLNGCIPIFFPAHFDFSVTGKIRRLLYLMKMLIVIPNGAFVFFQFPLYARMNQILIRRLAKKRTIHVICFITDIDGLKDRNDLLLKAEIRQLRLFHNFIVHNNAMKNWLKNHIKFSIAAQIEFFDFLAKPFQGVRHKSNKIVFAGNLSKSLFLEQLDELNHSERLLFNIYGTGVTDVMKSQKCCSYKGAYLPYEMPSLVQGSFGLVWDGSSISEDGGRFYDYMQYISHHKLSLYILSGLPVIIYANAGSAALISKYKIGIIINTMHDISEQLDKVSDIAYDDMRSNMKKLAARISNGDCLKNALKEVIENKINR